MSGPEASAGLRLSFPLTWSAVGPGWHPAGPLWTQDLCLKGRGEKTCLLGARYCTSEDGVRIPFHPPHNPPPPASEVWKLSARGVKSLPSAHMSEGRAGDSVLISQTLQPGWALVQALSPQGTVQGQGSQSLEMFGANTNQRVVRRLPLPALPRPSCITLSFPHGYEFFFWFY